MRIIFTGLGCNVIALALGVSLPEHNKWVAPPLFFVGVILIGLGLKRRSVKNKLPRPFIHLQEASRIAYTVYVKSRHVFPKVFGDDPQTRLENTTNQIWRDVPIYGQRDPSIVFELLTVHEKESGTWDVEESGISYLRNGNTKPFNNLCVKKNDLNAFLKKVSSQAKTRQYD